MVDETAEHWVGSWAAKKAVWLADLWGWTMVAWMAAQLVAHSVVWRAAWKAGWMDDPPVAVKAAWRVAWKAEQTARQLGEKMAAQKAAHWEMQKAGK